MLRHSTIQKIKKFCDEWNAGNIFGNSMSVAAARKYMRLLDDWISEHLGQDTDDGKLAEYMHGSLVSVIEWASFNYQDKEKRHPQMPFY